MPTRISVRLDDKMRAILEEEARARNMPLATLMCEIATAAAKEIRAARIRKQTAAVADHIARSPEAAEFMRDWAHGP
jgi:predicted DNA-binding ribbon-helix-helix protein